MPVRKRGGSGNDAIRVAGLPACRTRLTSIRQDGAARCSRSGGFLSSMISSGQRITLIALWLLAGSLAAIMATVLDSASFVDGRYIPAGNDAFYHARRILDAAIGTRGFYQFDAMIHVPEGSWITWPWAYDYLLAKALGVWLRISPASDPMAFLAYVPLTWVFVNTGLMLAICRRIGLSMELSAIALLAFALAPLTQQLHGVGMIDHHFIELTFSLASIWLGLGFFSKKSGRKDAIAYGFVLGIAPAFHNGLFILQIPVLAAACWLWWQGRPIDRTQVWAFCGALAVGTATALLPSAPFRDMQFEFATLSWFHLYVAFCTVACMGFFAGFSIHTLRRARLYFVIVATLLLVPLLVTAGQGAAFITGSTVRLDTIVEVKSPLRMYLDTVSSLDVTRYYSWLLLLAPVLLVLYIVRFFRAVDGVPLFFSASVVFGLLLLLAQYRLHPFGYWALLIAPLVLVEEARTRFAASRLAVGAGCLVVVALAFQPPLREQLFSVFPAGLTRDYAATRSLMPVLSDACADEAGTVLAYGDDGHPIRYHSDCSVIVNNFLLTELHGQKVREADRLLALTPEQLLAAEPGVEYVFARLRGLFRAEGNSFVPASIQELAAQNAPLFVSLVLRNDLPANFRLLGELRVDDERNIPYARVFKVERFASATD